jgi:hypothetical protein
MRKKEALVGQRMAAEGSSSAGDDLWPLVRHQPVEAAPLKSKISGNFLSNLFP